MQTAAAIFDYIDSIEEELIAIRRDFHRARSALSALATPNGTSYIRSIIRSLTLTRRRLFMGRKSTSSSSCRPPEQQIEGVHAIDGLPLHLNCMAVGQCRAKTARTIDPTSIRSLSSAIRQDRRDE